MAKESIKARERKRAKMVARYAAKRAALKEIVRTGEPEEVEKAHAKLVTKVMKSTGGEVRS
jgi:small subunit ribosomal protein S14